MLAKNTQFIALGVISNSAILKMGTNDVLEDAFLVSRIMMLRCFFQSIFIERKKILKMDA